MNVGACQHACTCRHAVDCHGMIPMHGTQLLTYYTYIRFLHHNCIVHVHLAVDTLSCLCRKEASLASFLPTQVTQCIQGHYMLSIYHVYTFDLSRPYAVSTVGTFEPTTLSITLSHLRTVHYNDPCFN